MTLEELSRIDRTIEIKAPPARVFQALTNAAELSAWFQVTIEGEIAAGKEVWMTSTQPGYTGMRFAVQFAEVTPPHRVVWKWHPGEVDKSINYDQEPRTTVTFTLEPTSTGTTLHLAETGFTEISLQRRAKAFSDNSEGWTVVLVWLQTHVEASS